MDDRKHLTGLEVAKLIAAVKGARHEARDRCLLLLLFRHGLRVSEACGMKLSQVDSESRVLMSPASSKGCPPRIRCGRMNFASSRRGSKSGRP
ncbi:MAG TPA: tyrosine-type recombinase/integrase [Candidatus Competibacteraceae bacterium]|nr:tyrosine-type recombinase/integrase [Candidatus Competibacteraceae bacterium]